MKRILVIEDQAEMRKLIHAMLATQDYEVVAAVDGRAAIQHLAETDFDAILVDLGLPDVRGEMVIQWILSNRPQLKPRILVVTGVVLQPGLEAMLETLKIPVLRKPFSKDELVAAVKPIAVAGEQGRAFPA